MVAKQARADYGRFCSWIQIRRRVEIIASSMWRYLDWPPPSVKNLQRYWDEKEQIRQLYL